MSVLGIDLGGTRIKGGRFVDGVLLASAERPSFGSASKEAILAALFAEIDSLWADDVERIGVASAGDIDPENGICTYATANLVGWSGTPIKSILESRYHVPVFVENDAIAALYGESLLYPNLSNLTLLTFGTGVGGASLIDGAVERSPRSRWGHCELVPDGRPCNCGKKGCAEAYLSATALYEEAKKSIPELADTKQLMALAEKGNPRAEEVLSRYGYYLNLLLKKIQKEIDPELILLGGGLMNAKDVIGPLVKTKKVAFASLGNEAGIRGAAALPIQNLQRRSLMTQKLKKGLIVSCQALPNEPLFGGDTMEKMALAAELGGADGIRANGVKDINGIAKKLNHRLPIIGLIKVVYPDSSVYITPTLKEAKKLMKAHCDVIALDGTSRPRPQGEKLEDLVAYLRQHSTKPLMADCATEADVRRCDELGFDYISTTMRGYTEDTKGIAIPDLPFLKEIRSLSLQHASLVAEGGIKDYSELQQIVSFGYEYVVIGGAITRPLLITQHFKEAFKRS